MERYAVIIIDVQKDCSLPGAALDVPGTYERRYAMRQVLDKARRENAPIIHVVRFYKEDGSNVDKFRLDAFFKKKCFLPNDKGSEILDELLLEDTAPLNSDLLMQGEFQKLGDNEWAMYKSRFGAFYNTNLEKFLRQLGVETLVFLGCNFPNCPRTSIFEACERDFSLAVITDALSGLYEQGETELKNIGALLMTADEFDKA